MKNADIFMENYKKPEFVKEIWFAEAVQELDMWHITNDEHLPAKIANFNNLIRAKRERWAAKPEIAEALKVGMEKGMEKKEIHTVLTCFDRGIDLDSIADFAGISVEAVVAILKLHRRTV